MPIDFAAREIASQPTPGAELNTRLVQVNTAAVDPTATDDETQGYQAGHHWINSVSGAEFSCTDNTATSAVWVAVPTPTSIVAKTSNTGSVVMPAGTTAQRDGSPAVGYQRWNSTIAALEVWDGAAWAALGGSSPQVIHVRDQKSSGSNAGSSVLGQQTRTLNTLVTNTISGASLAANKITLPAGTYDVTASAPAYTAGQHKIRLYDVTGAAVLAVGMCAYQDFSNLGANHASLNTTRFTLGVQSDVRLDHYIFNATTTFGLGVATSTGDVEVYADVRIEKVV